MTVQKKFDGTGCHLLEEICHSSSFEVPFYNNGSLELHIFLPEHLHSVLIHIKYGKMSGTRFGNGSPAVMLCKESLFTTTYISRNVIFVDYGYVYMSIYTQNIKINIFLMILIIQS